MKTILFIVSLFVFASGNAQTKNDTVKGTLLPVTYTDGVGLPTVYCDPVYCYTQMTFKNKKAYANWTRLKYNVKVVYPYAILASAKLKEYDRVLATLPNEAARKEYMKKAEKDLKKEFEDELKQLTYSQGKILIKLIDRETGHTSYDLVKQLRGSFSAFVWQGVASLFGSSLKSEYDAKGEDKFIEIAIYQIENGMI